MRVLPEQKHLDDRHAREQAHLEKPISAVQRCSSRRSHSQKYAKREASLAAGATNHSLQLQTHDTAAHGLAQAKPVACPICLFESKVTN